MSGLSWDDLTPELRKRIIESNPQAFSDQPVDTTDLENACDEAEKVYAEMKIKYNIDPSPYSLRLIDTARKFIRKEINSIQLMDVVLEKGNF